MKSHPVSGAKLRERSTGYAYPPTNRRALYVFQISAGLKPEYLGDDGVFSYSFVSEQIRPDFLPYYEYSIENYMAFLGEIRSENYFHNFDFPDSSKALNEIGFARGNPATAIEEFYTAGTGGDDPADENTYDWKRYAAWKTLQLIMRYVTVIGREWRNLAGEPAGLH